MSKLTKNLIDLSDKELEQRIAEMRRELVEQRKALAAGELLNPHAIKKTRLLTAAALTLQRQRMDKAEEEEAK